MKILTYIFAAGWAWLGFDFIFNQGIYIAGGVSVFFLLVCIAFISDFKTLDTRKIHGGRKWWVNTIGMTGVFLQAMGVAVLGSEMLITQPMATYIFAGVFGFFGLALFVKAHDMLKQGAVNVVKAKKASAAEANRDSFYANAAIKTNKTTADDAVRANSSYKSMFKPVADTPPPPKTKKPKAKAVLHYDTEEAENCVIQYRDAKGKVSERGITIKNITDTGERELISAFCHLRNSHKTFFVDNIIALVDPKTGTSYESDDAIHNWFDSYR